ncbi:MAG: metal-dependent hydrolase [Pseudomonadota bacterium]
MDPVSQAALGAVVGHVAGYRRLGHRAAVVGALAGALPDVDVLFSAGGDYFDQLVAHRGITHSLFFAPVAGPLLGALVWRLQRRSVAPPAGAGSWMLVVTLALLSHPLLDYLTPYGTQLLLPFSQQRFAVNAMPIIDPVYTLVLLLGLAVAVTGSTARRRRSAPWVALGTLLVSCGYLGYGGYQNRIAEERAAAQLAASGVEEARVAAFPTILQVHYRRVVARTPDEDLVGFVSTWAPCPVVWTRAPRGERGPAVASFLATREGRIFDWFTMGWARYRLEPAPPGQRLQVTDLRYGFTTDPNRSIFSVSAVVDLAGEVIQPVRAGRAAADATAERLALLFQEAYAPACGADVP